MLHPAGARASPNHHHVLLMNWARPRAIRLGNQGWRGVALFARRIADGRIAWIVEERGSGQGRQEFPFDDRRSRSRALAEALAAIEAR
jgi:hypothetical protein